MHAMEPEELMAYLDGELTAERSAAAAAHLVQCRECQAVAADLESVSRRLLEWQIEDASPRLDRAVHAAWAVEHARPTTRRGLLWVGGLLAAGVVMMVVTRSTPEVRLERVATQQNSVASFAQDGRVRPAPPPPQSGQRNLMREPANGNSSSINAALPQTPLIIRTAQITLSTTGFAKARASLEDVLKRHGGHVGSLTVGSPADSGQTLQATLRVPSSQLDATLAEVRKLGRVESEQQGGEEVTAQVVDLEARLANSRNTEGRLADILRRSAGKIADVLAVEKEMDRVRGEIERMQAERKGLGDRFDFATLEVRVNEEYKAHLDVAAPSAFGRMRNAAVAGYRNVADSLTGFAMFVLAYGPGFLVWGALLFFPVRYAWRRSRTS
jgi:anti-sigma factor RsiW